MATVRENLLARYTAISEILASGVTSDGQSLDRVNVTIDGESRDTVGYKKSLYEEMTAINEQLEGSAANGGAVATKITEIRPR